MNIEKLDLLTQLIYDHCGIKVEGAHVQYLNRIIKNRLETTNHSFEDFYKILLEKTEEFETLVNAITINETYFFRESKQFEYLYHSLLPQKKNQSISIWSAACSTGEEAYSLATLCKSLDLDAKIFASDINTLSLEKLSKASYSNTSFREDGKSLQFLLEPYLSIQDTHENAHVNIHGDKKFLITKELKDIVYRFYFNLFCVDKCKEKLKDSFFDIIFLRNVFIYFSEETKRACIKFMEKKLKPGGLLFVSTSEIASVEVTSFSSLKKCKDSGVYFFCKEDRI